jgi:hypothetical protein
MLPVSTVQVRLVIRPIDGGDGTAFTDRIYVAIAGEQGDPNGLSVVTVMITNLPLSPAAGVYVKENGDVVIEDWSTDPAPFSVIATPVALPPKVLPETGTGVVPQVLPLSALRTTTGSFAHPHDTAKKFPIVVHPSVFLTARRWLPFATSANEVPG